MGIYLWAKQRLSYPYAENFPLIAFRDAGSHTKGGKVVPGCEEQIHFFNMMIQKGKAESLFCK